MKIRNYILFFLFFSFMFMHNDSYADTNMSKIGDPEIDAYTRNIERKNTEIANSQTQPLNIPAKATLNSDGSCELGENCKKAMAQQAHDSLKNSYDKLIELNEYLDKVYISSGACNFLYGTDTEKWWKEATTGTLEYNEHAIKGAQIITQKKWATEGSISTFNLATYFNTKNGYTDWNFQEVKRRLSGGINNIQQLIAWAKTAKKGDSFEINEAASEILEEIFDYRVDCKRAVMDNDSGAFSCKQSSDKAREGLKETAEDLTDNAKEIVKDAKECKGWGCVADGVIDAAKTTYNTVKGQAQAVLASSEVITDALDSVTGLATAFSCGKGETCSGPDWLDKQLSNKKIAENCMTELDNLLLKRQAIQEPNARIEAHRLLDIISGEVEVVCKGCTGGEDGSCSVDSCEVNDPDYEEDPLQECKTLAQYQKELSTCLICDLLATILIAVQNIANKSFEVIGTPMAELVGIGFLLFLAYTSLMMVANPETQKISQYINTLLTQGFKVFIVLFILKNPATIYDLAVSPILNSGIDLGLTLSGDSAMNFANKGAKYNIPAKEGAYIDSEVLKRVVGSVDQFSEDAAMMPAVGRAMICQSFHINNGDLVQSFFPNTFMLIEGLLIYIFGYALVLVLGVYLLDCILQMGIICALMPLFVAAWPFKLTSSYTKQGWNMLLNTFFNFVMTGVVIVTIVEVIKNAVVLGGDFENEINNNMVAAIGADIGLGGLKMVLVITCVFMCFKMTNQIPLLANQFASGANLGIGGKMLSTAAGTAASLIKVAMAAITVATAGAGGAVMGAAKTGATVAKNTTKHAIKAGKNAVKKGAKKAMGKEDNENKDEQEA